MTSIKTVASTGLTLPTPAYLMGAILFGVIGYAAYRYGKKNELFHPRWIGVALMIFPYAVTRTWLMYVVGSCLCAGLLILRS